MNAPRMPEDIRNQPASLASVLAHQFGAGKDILLEAGQRLSNSTRIIVTGMGASLYAAMPLASRLSEQGFPVRLTEASELLHYESRSCKDATVLLVSRSGETVEILKLLPELKTLGALTIGVTNESGSTLAKQTDLPLFVGSSRDEAVAIQTYTGTAFALLLLSKAALGEYKEVDREVEGVIETAHQLVEQFSEHDLGWDGFLEHASCIYILGRGPSLASAYESALLLNETAKLASTAVPLGTFRHGPVEVVDRHFHGVVFATHARTRELDFRLASDLEQMGAQVKMIGLNGAWHLESVPEFFLPVVEIIPMQFAALRAAVLRGARPGEFRYVSHVTTSETGFKAYG